MNDVSGKIVFVFELFIFYKSQWIITKHSSVNCIYNNDIIKIEFGREDVSCKNNA